MALCVIPARGGSKRTVDKNIRLFAGQPLIKYSIVAAFASGVFKRVIVSTDSEAIATVARDLGAEVPFLRPPDLSDDFTPTASVLVHAIRAIAAESGEVPQHVCCLYATAPFVRAEDLRAGREILGDTGVSSVFSVTTFGSPIFRAFKRTEVGTLAMFWPEYELTRSNDLSEAYHDAGQFYWVNGSQFLETPRFYTPDALPIVLPRFRVQDIDTPEDWETAEYMFYAQAFAHSSKSS